MPQDDDKKTQNALQIKFKLLDLLLFVTIGFFFSNRKKGQRIRRIYYSFASSPFKIISSN